MTDQPNPFSRSGAEPPGGTDAPAPAPAWPSYPVGPSGSTAPTESSAPYDQIQPAPPGPYAQPNPYGQTQPNPYGQQIPDGPGGSYPPVPAYGTSAYGTSPYGPATYGTNPYAAAAYGYTPAAHPQAVLSLVLGVIGLVVCSYVGIAALILGLRARREIAAQPQRYSGGGMATAGLVLGIVGSVLAVLLTLFIMIGLAGGWDE